MKKTLGTLIPFISLFFVSCQKESDPCASLKPDPEGIMQRIMLIELDEWGHNRNRHGWGISDINNKTVELIALAEDGFLLKDGEGNVVKQVAWQVEARPYGGGSYESNSMELYMDSPDIRDNSGELSASFILKIDEGLWFKIKAWYYRDECARTRLKGIVFDENQEYVKRWWQKNIPIDEAKKREKLKKEYPDGFPYV